MNSTQKQESVNALNTISNDKTNSGVSMTKEVEQETLKPAFVVNTESIVGKVSTETNDEAILSKTIINEHQDVLSNELQIEEALIQEHVQVSPSKLNKRIWLVAVLLVVTLSVAQLFNAISLVINQHRWLAGGWLILFCLAFIVAVRIMYSELRSLQRLKKQSEVQQQSADLFNTPAIGLGQLHCEAIARQLPKQYQRHVKEWENGLQSHYTNMEVLSLFELKVLSPIDKIALSKITTNASAAGVMIAVSPFAMLDMLIVLWRNIKLINQLSSLYGVRLGYWGRIALIKKIFRSMLYAGAMEILSDAGNYALGVGLTGKISTRVAQGLGAGILTSRIGLKALNECRPMPWLSIQKPGLTHMTNQLVEDLTKYLK
jgi:putative membrane protein